MLNWELPYLTRDIPGIGGAIRVEIEDFVVDEVPAYEPCGSGEHVYFRVEKRDLSTMMLINQIAERLGVATRDVSSAGLKDARAVARQTLSVQGVPQEAVERLELDRARILWVNRHTNKLRTGHLRGNDFTIRIRQVNPDAPANVPAVMAELLRRGVPNGYGPQRFGDRRDNHIVGLCLVRDDRAGLQEHGILRHPSYRMQQFLVSALQSALFNQVAARRMESGTLDDVIRGDIAKKEDTGGIFTVEDAAVERPRVQAWEISPTGPIYGFKMMQAKWEAGALEAEILAAAGLTLGEFRKVDAEGVRRPLRYYPRNLAWRFEPDGDLVVSFFAPKGSYATMLLRELMKTDIALDEG